MGHSEDPQQPLHRIPSCLDCPSLVSQCTSFKPEIRRNQHTSCSSENSQILYMAPVRKPRRTHQSLSSIGNSFDRRVDGSADGELNTKTKLSTAEQFSWDIIDREIFEWQYVCQTGRPFWWSPEAKHTRLKNLQPSFGNEPSSRSWMKKIDQRAKPAYAEKRRVLSDSYLSDVTTVQDLAHLVAVQLLGACFTLPPDHVIGDPGPNYSGRTKYGLSKSPNPRLISSLRLHTHFRYSPSFGHQARNTSPVQLWPGIFDGPSNSEVTSPSDETFDHSGPSRTRPRFQRRKSFNCERGFGDLDKTGNERSFTDLPKTSLAWYRRHGIQEFNSRVLRIPHNLYSGKRLKRKTRLSKTETDPNDNTPVTEMKPFHMIIKNNDRNRVIEFAPPEQRPTVRRWAKLRNRFGGSLNVDVSISDPEDLSHNSESSSPPTAGVARRSTNEAGRRVGKRGDIESSSMDESPHYNSPTSGNLSPAEMGISGLQSLILASTLRSSEHLNTATTLAASTYSIPQHLDQHRQSLILSPSEISIPEPVPRLPVPPINTSFAAINLAPARSDACDCLHPNTSPTSMGPGIPTPLRRVSTRGRDRRKSMLSEVWTLDDFPGPKRHRSECSESCDRNSITVPGSALASPQEEIEQYLVTPGLGTAMAPGQDGTVSRRSASFDEAERIWFHRTSYGTQIFTPDTDGIEVDGLPVGPGQEAWATGERTYL